MLQPRPDGCDQLLQGRDVDGLTHSLRLRQQPSQEKEIKIRVNKCFLQQMILPVIADIDFWVNNIQGRSIAVEMVTLHAYEDPSSDKNASIGAYCESMVEKANKLLAALPDDAKEAFRSLQDEWAKHLVASLGAFDEDGIVADDDGADTTSLTQREVNVMMYKRLWYPTIAFTEHTIGFFFRKFKDAALAYGKMTDIQRTAEVKHMNVLVAMHLNLFKKSWQDRFMAQAYYNETVEGTDSPLRLINDEILVANADRNKRKQSMLEITSDIAVAERVAKRLGNDGGLGKPVVHQKLYSTTAAEARAISRFEVPYTSKVGAVVQQQSRDGTRAMFEFAKTIEGAALKSTIAHPKEMVLEVVKKGLHPMPVFSSDDKKTGSTSIKIAEGYSMYNDVFFRDSSGLFTKVTEFSTAMGNQREQWRVLNKTPGFMRAARDKALSSLTLKASEQKARYKAFFASGAGGASDGGAAGGDRMIESLPRVMEQ
jgi:hypothetical protein